MNYTNTENVTVTNTNTALTAGLNVLPSDLKTAVADLALAGPSVGGFGGFNLVVPFTGKTFGDLLDPGAILEKLSTDFQSQAVVTTFDVTSFLQGWNGASAYADGTSITVGFTGAPTV